MARIDAVPLFARVLACAVVGFITFFLWWMLLAPMMLQYVFKSALNLYIQLGGVASLASPKMFTVTKWLAFSTNAIATVPLGIAIGILLRYLSVGQPVVCLIAFVVGINFLPLASIPQFDDPIRGPLALFYGVGDFPLIQLVAAVVIFWRRLPEGAPPNNKLQRTRGGSFGGQ